jgi:hypothetical protein
LSPAEFLEAAKTLVGSERGSLRRIARLLDVSEKTVYAISDGNRPVPEFYAQRIREQLASTTYVSGTVIPYVSPRLQLVLEAAVSAGWSERDALGAIAAWAAMRLSAAA